jgi:hypothetical protein
LTTSLPLLPVGVSSFEKIRRINAVYVDKTAYIPELSKNGEVIFCARPRRFGKSLMCSTVDAYYSGKEELFQGLAAAKNMRAKGFVPKPVIFMDMSGIAGSSSKEMLESGLLRLVQKNAAKHDVDVNGDNAAISFENLIENVYLKHSKTGVVVIIDEYDSPIIKLIQNADFFSDHIKTADNIVRNGYNIDRQFDNSLDKQWLSTINALPDESPEKAKLLLANIEREKIMLENKKIMLENKKILLALQAPANAQKILIEDTRKIMERFYSQLKLSSGYLDLVFITGVTKFSSMGLFSTFNNLFDITLNSKFSAFFGYTQNELETNFAPFIEDTGNKLNLTNADLLKRLKEYYNGFSFDGKARLYNPQSILYFFQQGEFFNFWMESGSNSVIRQLLMAKHFDLNVYNKEPFNRNYIYIPGLIESVSPDLYLYQAGYLTIRKNDNGTYYFAYPNFEVNSSMNYLFMENLYNSEKKLQAAMTNLIAIILKGNVLELIKIIRTVFSNISFINYKQMTRDNTGESFYQNILMAFLMGAGVHVTTEAHTNFGRVDLVARYENRVYVIEMKTADNDKDARKAIDEGMSQIVKGNYVGPYNDPIVLLLVALKKERNIGACVFWREGKTDEVQFDKIEMALPPRQD